VYCAHALPCCTHSLAAQCTDVPQCTDAFCQPCSAALLLLLQTYTWQEAYQAALQSTFNATLEQLTTAQVGQAGQKAYETDGLTTRQCARLLRSSGVSDAPSLPPDPAANSPPLFKFPSLDTAANYALEAESCCRHAVAFSHNGCFSPLEQICAGRE